MFKPTKEGSQPSGADFLTNPYVGPVRPIDVDVKKVGNVEDCFVLEFKLLGEDLQGNDVSGVEQEYVEWNPEGKPEKQQKNAVNRLAYVAMHFAPEEEVIGKFDEDGNHIEGTGISADTWKEYASKITDLLKRHNFTDRNDIEFKWVGDVWKGEPKIKTPGYHNFIANKDSEQSLSWSPSEQQDNKEYLKAKNSQPTDPDEADEVDDVADQSF